MRTDENMRPKSFPIAGWFLIIGAIVLLIGILSWKITGGAEHYLQLSDVHSENDADLVKRIALETGNAEITLTVSSDVDKVIVDARDFPEEEYGIGVQGDTLRIYQKRTISLIGFSAVDFLKKTTKIDIIVPDKLYDELKIDNGGGTFKINGLSAKEADIDHGAGDFTLENCAFDEMDLDCGAGSCELVSCVCGTVDIDCGTGEISYQGEINSDSSIDCGVGDLKLDLAASYLDYDLDIDKGVGDVDINKGSSPSTGRDIKLDINCGVGQVTISFE